MAQPPRFRTPARPSYQAYLRDAWLLPGRSQGTPAAARDLVGDICREWRIPRAAVPDTVLIVSELATNAVSHAPGDELSVAVLLSARHVWVVVTDQGPYKPLEIRPDSPHDEHGRGLRIVDGLAARWAAEPEGTGTRVWACIELPPRRELPGHLLPRPTRDEAGVPHPTTEDGCNVLHSHA